MNNLNDLSLPLESETVTVANKQTLIQRRLRNWVADKIEPDYDHVIRGSVMIRIPKK